MYVNSSAAKDGRVEELRVSANDGEDLTPLRSALGSGRWFRVGPGGKFEEAPYYNEPPKTVYDKDIEPIWKEGPVILRGKAKKREWSPSVYVQSIGGYTGGREKKAQRMIVAGFSVLRSKRGLDGECWEVWYLPGAWAAKGEIDGKDIKGILKWLRYKIKPGNIELSGESWGLSYEG